VTYTTEYETRDGKTYRAGDTPPAAAAETAAAPKPNGADNKTPGKPVKEGA
jgi:hypothetical protein